MCEVHDLVPPKAVDIVRSRLDQNLLGLDGFFDIEAAVPAEVLSDPDWRAAVGTVVQGLSEFRPVVPVVGEGQRQQENQEEEGGVRRNRARRDRRREC